MDTIQAKYERALKIIREVKSMRDLQKQFFKGDKAVIAQAKIQEKKVDAMITDHERGTTQSLLGE